MWCYACSWDVRSDLTLNSMAQIHTSVTLLTSRDLAWSSGRLTWQHASQISTVAHISWDVTYVSSALQTLPVFFPETEELLIKKVRQRTFLYDTKWPDYRDQHMRANAWEGIGKKWAHMTWGQCISGLRFVRLALKFVIPNDGNFVNVILLHIGLPWILVVL